MERDPPKSAWGGGNLAKRLQSDIAEEAKRIANLANQTRVVVEVGAGTGAMAWFLATNRERLAHYLGIPDLVHEHLECIYWATDYGKANAESPRLLQLDKAPSERFTVVCKRKPSDVDAEKLSETFEADSVDVVLSVCCWGYYLNVTFVTSALAVLKPGGKIVMLAPTNLLFKAGMACFAAKAQMRDLFLGTLGEHNQRHDMRCKSNHVELMPENCNRYVEQELSQLFALCDSTQVEILLFFNGSHEYMANNFTSSAIDSRHPHEDLRGWNTRIVIRGSTAPRVALCFKDDLWSVPRPE